MFKLDLKKILKLFPGRPGRDIVGIDFTGNNLKIAHVRLSPAKKEIVDLVTKTITGFTEVDIAKAVNTSFHALTVRNPVIVTAIPAHMVITKNIEIPSVDPKEIRDIINLQAGRHTPYSREEIIVDYIDIGVYNRNYTKILLIIVARSIVKKQYDMLEKAGLKLDKVVLAPETLAWSASKILKIETNEAPAGLIHVDEATTDFAVIYKAKTIFVRSIPIGAISLVTERERSAVRFADEVKRSLEAYMSENIERTPAVIVMTGALDEIRGIETVVAGAVSVPVRVAPYLGSTLVSEAALRTAGLARRLSFLNVIAPLLAGEETKVDLVPEEVRLRKSIEDRGRDLIKSGILVLTVFVLICISLIAKIYFKSAYLKKLDARFVAIDKEAQGLEKEYTQITVIKNYLRNRGYSIEVITELHTLTPLGVELGDIRYDDLGKLVIRGSADSMSSVFSYVDQLEGSDLFKEVKTKYTSKRKEGAVELTDFEIGVQLEKKKK